MGLAVRRAAIGVCLKPYVNHDHDGHTEIVHYESPCFIDSDDYLPLPSKFDIDEYHIMEDFCCSVVDDEIRGKLFPAYVLLQYVFDISTRKM